MDVITILECILGLGLVVVAIIYKKWLNMKSNIPSLGYFYLKRGKQRYAEDIKEFAEKNNAGLVHAMADGHSCVFITHPDTAQIMLKDEITFIKAEIGGDEDVGIGPLMKTSLINQNGEEWKKLKNIMAPSFHHENMKDIVPVFIQKTYELMNAWEENGKDVAIRTAMSHFTVDTLGLFAFGVDFKTIGGESHGYLDAYSTLISVPQKPKEDRRHATETLSKMTYAIMEQEKKNKGKPESQIPHLLQRLLMAQGQISQETIRDNIFMMFLAGHETTSTALTWALHFFAIYPEMQKKAQDEVDSFLNGATPGMEEVKSLTFLDLFIKEVMRKRTPIANIMSRKTTADTQVGKYLVPKDSYVNLSIYTMHHLKEFWPEPEKFDPYRFTPENSAGRHPFAYMPFSLGKRNCIGNNFSLLEQKIFLAIVLQRFTVTTSDKCMANLLPVYQVNWPYNIVLNFTPRFPDKK